MVRSSKMLTVNSSVTSRFVRASLPHVTFLRLKQWRLTRRQRKARRLQRFIIWAQQVTVPRDQIHRPDCLSRLVDVVSNRPISSTPTHHLLETVSTNHNQTYWK